MKTKLSVLLLSLVMVVGQSQTLTSWAKQASLGNDFANRIDANMLAYNGEIYIMGGYDNSSGGKDFAKYNPQTDKLTNLKSFDYASANPTYQGMFEVGGKFYTIYGGYLKIYDPSTGNWTSTLEQNNFYGLSRVGGGFVIGTTIYFIDELSTMVAYDTVTKTFSKKANKPVANLRGFFAFSIDGKGYMGGGIVNLSTAAFYEYDPQTNSWTAKASMPKAFHYGVGSSANGKGYVGLGINVISSTTTTNLKWYEFTPTSNSWAEKSDQNVTGGATYNASTAVIGNDVYVYGGGGYANSSGSSSQPYSGVLRKYNTVSNQWSYIRKLGDNRYQTSGVYQNGKIFVANGFDGYAVSPNDIFEYDIAANNWQKKTDFPSYHIQNPMNAAIVNDKMYFVGGYRGGYNTQLYSNVVSEYNITTNTWTQKNNFPYTGGYIFTTVHNNEIYAFGGMNSGQNNANVRKYNQNNDTWATLASAPTIMSTYNGAFAVVGDDVYYIKLDGSTANLYRYSITNNNWVTVVTNMQLGGASAITSRLFGYNNKLYIMLQIGAGSVIKEFNATTNNFSDAEYFSNVPFQSDYQLAVAVPDGVYFGMGVRVEYPTRHVSNSWSKLRFNAQVSTDIGDFQTGYYDDEVGDGNYNPVCNFGVNLQGENSSAALYDFKGNLFASIIGNQQTSVNLCIKVNSRALSLPYFTHVENNKRKTYLNKGFIVSAKNTNEKVRFYYTTQELQSFVTNYNMLYSTSKTINDIKMINAYIPSDVIDFNPLNNSSSNFVTYPAFTLQNYGSDKYFETTAALQGELYLYLESEVLAVNEASKNAMSIYPNPVKDILHIQNNNGGEIKTVRIYDVSGRQVMSVAAQKEINVTKLQKGIYNVQVETNNQVKSFKIIKE